MRRGRVGTYGARAWKCQSARSPTIAPAPPIAMARVHRPEIRRKYILASPLPRFGRIIHDSVPMHGQIDQLPRRTAAQISDTSDKRPSGRAYPTAYPDEECECSPRCSCRRRCGLRGFRFGLRSGVVITPQLAADGPQQASASRFTIGPLIEVFLWRGTALGGDFLLRRSQLGSSSAGSRRAEVWQWKAPITLCLSGSCSDAAVRARGCLFQPCVRHQRHHRMRAWAFREAVLLPRRQ